MEDIALIGRRNSFSNSYGQGIERFKYELANRILNIDDELTIRKLEPTLLPSFVSNRTYSGLNFLFGSFFSRFNEFSIVHNLDQLPLFAPFKGTQTLLLQTLYDFQATEYTDSFSVETTLSGKIKKNLFVRMSKFQEKIKDEVDHYIAISSSTKYDAIKHGFDPLKITVINLGIDERFTNTEIPQKKSGRVVGYIGSFSLNKNLQFAMRAFSMLPNRDIEFRIYGKNHDFNKYKAIDKDIIIDNRIKFIGFAPEEKLVEIYDQFSVLVFPSLVEGFGIPILEAQSRGIPVILLKNSKIPQEVRKYCIEVETYSEMAESIDNCTRNSLSESYIKDMINYAKNFTWDKTVSDTAKLYKRLLS